MKMDPKTRSILAAALTLAVVWLAGCETFVADGDESVGLHERGGYFYLADNDADRLIMLDRNMHEVRSWPFSDFTSEGYVQGLTYDGQTLWVSVSGGDDLLYQLDLADGASIETIRTLPAPPDGQGTVRDLAWDGQVLWVLNSGSTTYNSPPELFEIDPADGAILSRHPLPSVEPRGMCFVGPNADAYGAGATEGCYYTDKDDDVIYVFRTGTRVFTDGFPAPVGPRGDNYVYPLGLFFDGVDFWSTNSSGVADYLFNLDYEGKPAQRVDLPYEQPGAIVWTAGDLTAAGPPLVTEVSPSTGGPSAHKVVTVRGSGFRDGLTVDFGVGVAVDSLTYGGSTEFVAYITVAGDADLGARNVVVTNPDGQHGAGAGLFSVVEFDPSTGYLWFIDNGTDLLHRYSINDGSVVADFDPALVAPGGSLQGLAFDGTDIWLSASGSDDIVARVDVSSSDLTALQSFQAPPSGTGTVRDMAFDGTHLWIPNNGSASIYRVDPATGIAAEVIPSPGAEPRGVAWAEGVLYCNDKDLDAVFAWDPGATSWTQVFEMPVPPGGTATNRYPTGMTWDGFSFWIANSTGEFDYFFQVAPDGTLLTTIEVPERGAAQPTGLVFTRN